MEKFYGIIRHILTFLGGLLVAKGWIDEGMMLEIVAVVMTLIGIIWSIYEKNNRKGIGNA